VAQVAKVSDVTIDKDGRPRIYAYEEGGQLSAANPGAWIQLDKGTDYSCEPASMKANLVTASARDSVLIQIALHKGEVFYRLIQWEAPEAELPETDEHA